MMTMNIKVMMMMLRVLVMMMMVRVLMMMMVRSGRKIRRLVGHSFQEWHEGKWLRPRQRAS